LAGTISIRFIPLTSCTYYVFTDASGGNGDDTINSGDGDDFNVGDSAGEEGDDVINSGDGDDQNDGGLGDDVIKSGKGDDTGVQDLVTYFITSIKNDIRQIIKYFWRERTV
jgi:Ca2+-binding RTX toxin-like protein